MDPAAPATANLYNTITDNVLVKSESALGVTSATYTPRNPLNSPLRDIAERGKPTLLPISSSRRHLSRIFCQSYFGAHNLMRSTLYRNQAFAPIDRRCTQPFVPPTSKEHPLIADRAPLARIKIQLNGLKPSDDQWHARATVAALFTLQPDQVWIVTHGHNAQGIFLRLVVNIHLDWDELLADEELQAVFNLDEWLAMARCFEAGFLEEQKIRNLALSNIPSNIAEYKEYQKKEWYELLYADIRPPATDRVYTQILPQRQGGVRPVARYDRYTQTISYLLAV